MRNYFIHEKTNAKTNVCKITQFGPLAGNVADETLGLGYTRYASNVRISNGRLLRASGVDYARKDGVLLPSSVIIGKTISHAMIYKRYDYTNKTRDDRLIIKTDDGLAYEWNEENFTFDELAFLTEYEPFLLNYQYKGKDVLLAFCKEGHVALYDGSSITTGQTPILTDACVYNERIYGIVDGESGKLRHSSNHDPFGWNDITTGAGVIQFSDEGGALKKVVVCGDSLYVFREYAVYRLVGNKDDNEYVMTKIYSTHSPIYCETIGCWNGILYFMANDGFNKVDGSRVSTVWTDEFSIIEDKTNASATCYDGKYYITAKFYLDEDDAEDSIYSGLINNGVMVIYIGSGGGVEIIRGVDIKEFVPCCWDGVNYLYLVNSIGLREMSLSMFTDDGLQYGNYPESKWTSPEVFLGKKSEDVIVRSITARTRQQIEMKVKLASDHDLTFNAGPDVSTNQLNRRGQTIQISISSWSPQLCFYGFEIEYETTERLIHNSNLR